MKKYFTLAAAIVLVILLSNCHTAKKASAKTTAPSLTYQANIQSLVINNCSPCHFPAKGGNKKPLDTYDAVKANIDDMIHRIELSPTDKGLMRHFYITPSFVFLADDFINTIRYSLDAR